MAATEISRWRAQWKQAQDERGTHHHGLVLPVRRFSDAILYVAAPLALFRGTQMWHGWPTVQSEFVPGFNLSMSGQLYALVALLALYFVINMREIYAVVRSSNLLLGIFVCFASLSVLFSIDIQASILNVMAVSCMSLPLLIFYWRFGAIKSLEMLRIFSIFTIIVCLIYAVVQPQYAFMGGSLAGDFRGLFPHKNGFGPMMALACIALLPSPSQGALYQPMQLVRLLFAIIALACTVASHSSTSLVLIAIGILFLIFSAIIREQRTAGIRAMTTVFLFVAVVAVNYFGGMLVASTIAEVSGKDLTFSGRSYVWEALWPHLFDYPATGYGFGIMRQVKYVVPLLKDVPFGVNSPHNTYLEIVLNLGLFGGLSWIAFVLKRLFDKIVDRPATAIEAMCLNRECAIIAMIVISGMTEAGRMLAPTVTWPILAMVLPLAARYPLLSPDSVRRGGQGPAGAGRYTA